jgi:hypothetical protein
VPGCSGKIKDHEVDGVLANNSQDGLPPPPPACLLRRYPSTQKGGTLVADDVPDLHALAALGARFAALAALDDHEHPDPPETYRDLIRRRIRPDLYPT